LDQRFTEISLILEKQSATTVVDDWSCKIFVNPPQVNTYFDSARASRDVWYMAGMGL
jgi:hypothetical protein